MEAVRIDAQLDVSLTHDRSCSVLWLVPQFSRLSAEFSIAETRMLADGYEFLPREGDWFWERFVDRVRPIQICGAITPPGARESAGWKYSGLQLVLSAAARQARPGASHGYTLNALHQAFLAEVLAVGGLR